MPMAGWRSGQVFMKPGHLPAAFGRLARPPRGPGGSDLLWPGSPPVSGAAGSWLDEERRRCRTLLGRLAAVFYIGSGLLGLVTLPLPAPGSNRAATAAVCVAALVAG